MDSRSISALTIVLNHEMTALHEALEEIERLRGRIATLQREKDHLLGMCVALRMRIFSLHNRMELLLGEP